MLPHSLIIQAIQRAGEREGGSRRGEKVRKEEWGKEGKSGREVGKREAVSFFHFVTKLCVSLQYCKAPVPSPALGGSVHESSFSHGGGTDFTGGRSPHTSVSQRVKQHSNYDFHAVAMVLRAKPLNAYQHLQEVEPSEKEVVQEGSSSLSHSPDQQSRATHRLTPRRTPPPPRGRLNPIGGARDSGPAYQHLQEVEPSEKEVVQEGEPIQILIKLPGTLENKLFHRHSIAYQHLQEVEPSEKEVVQEGALREPTLMHSDDEQHWTEPDLTQDSTRQEADLTQDSTRQEADLTQDSTRQEEDLTQDSTRQEADLTQDSTRQEADLTQNSTRQEADLTQDCTRQEADLTQDSTRQEVDLTQDSTRQEADLTQDSTRQEADLTQDSTRQEADLTQDSTRQEADLTLSPAAALWQC
ncbi:UNVERIFIED_CONTAM: hypothetical protein FKN15_075265 [Acipenser sinensis]